MWPSSLDGPIGSVRRGLWEVGGVLGIGGMEGLDPDAPHPPDGLALVKAYSSKASRQILHTARTWCTIHHFRVRGPKDQPSQPGIGWR